MPGEGTAWSAHKGPGALHTKVNGQLLRVMQGPVAAVEASVRALSLAGSPEPAS